MHVRRIGQAPFVHHIGAGGQDIAQGEAQKSLAGKDGEDTGANNKQKAAHAVLVRLSVSCRNIAGGSDTQRWGFSR